MQSISEQEAYWDKVAEEKEFGVSFQIHLFCKYVSKEMKVLDFGCGYGRILNDLFQYGYKDLVGIDSSQGMINRGLRQYPYLNLIKMCNSVIPFPDDTFHAVILISVLTCIPENEKQAQLITEVLRVLKRGGILYIHDCMLNQDRRNIERYNKYKEKYGEYGVFQLPEGVVVRHYSKEHLIEITKEFDQIIFEKSTHTTMNGNKTNGFCFIGRKKEK